MSTDHNGGFAYKTAMAFTGIKRFTNGSIKDIKFRSSNFWALIINKMIFFPSERNKR